MAKKKPIPEIASYFGVSRQWIHYIIKRLNNQGLLDAIHLVGRKSKDIHEKTRFLILKELLDQH